MLSKSSTQYQRPRDRAIITSGWAEHLKALQLLPEAPVFEPWKKKLIKVALPLEAVNRAAAREMVKIRRLCRISGVDHNSAELLGACPRIS